MDPGEFYLSLSLGQIDINRVQMADVLLCLSGLKRRRNDLDQVFLLEFSTVVSLCHCQSSPAVLFITQILNKVSVSIKLCSF